MHDERGGVQHEARWQRAIARHFLASFLASLALFYKSETNEHVRCADARLLAVIVALMMMTSLLYSRCCSLERWGWLHELEDEVCFPAN